MAEEEAEEGATEGAVERAVKEVVEGVIGGITEGDKVEGITWTGTVEEREVIVLKIKVGWVRECKKEFTCTLFSFRGIFPQIIGDATRLWARLLVCNISSPKAQQQQ